MIRSIRRLFRILVDRLAETSWLRDKAGANSQWWHYEQHARARRRAEDLHARARQRAHERHATGRARHSAAPRPTAPSGE